MTVRAGGLRDHVTLSILPPKDAKPFVGAFGRNMKCPRCNEPADYLTGPTTESLRCSDCAALEGKEDAAKE